MEHPVPSSHLELLQGILMTLVLQVDPEATFTFPKPEPDPEPKEKALGEQ